MDEIARLSTRGYPIPLLICRFWTLCTKLVTTDQGGQNVSYISTSCAPANGFARGQLDVGGLAGVVLLSAGQDHVCAVLVPTNPLAVLVTTNPLGGSKLTRC